jgi:type I restriction enzyme R subunit
MFDKHSWFDSTTEGEEPKGRQSSAGKQMMRHNEFQKFLLDQKPEQADRIAQMRYFFDAYIKDSGVRRIIDDGKVADLNVNPIFGMKDLRAVPEKWRKRIPEYIKDYVSLNPFM